MFWTRISLALTTEMQETVQRIVKHAAPIKEGKAEEILKRLEDFHSDAK